jgi:zinc protease
MHEMEQLTREDVLAWYQRFYAPNNAILVVAGDINAAELRPLAERYYGAIPSRPVPQRLRPQEPPPAAERRVSLRDPRVAQPEFSRAWLAPSRHSQGGEQSYALEVLADIIGGGQTARLSRALVIDQELAVGAGAYYDPDAVDTSSFSVRVNARPGVDIATVETAVDREIARVLSDGVTDDEVARSIARMQAAAVLARDSVANAARVFGEVLTTGGTVDEVEAWPDRISAVTAAQVNAAARAVLRPERSATGLLLPQARQ